MHTYGALAGISLGFAAGLVRTTDPGYVRLSI
jgi:hypothetical protein